MVSAFLFPKAQILHGFTGTINLGAQALDDALIKFDFVNPLEGLTFVEDSEGRLIAEQTDNKLLIKGELIDQDGGTGEIILGGINPVMLGEVIQLTVPSSMNNTATMFAETKVSEQGLHYSYDPSVSVDALGRYVIDLDDTGWFYKGADYYSGKSFTITLTWINYSAQYIVEFSPNYKDNISG